MVTLYILLARLFVCNWHLDNWERDDCSGNAMVRRVARRGCFTHHRRRTARRQWSRASSIPHRFPCLRPCQLWHVGKLLCNPVTLRRRRHMFFCELFLRRQLRFHLPPLHLALLAQHSQQHPRLRGHHYADYGRALCLLGSLHAVHLYSPAQSQLVFRRQVMRGCPRLLCGVDLGHRIERGLHWAELPSFP